MKIDLYKKINIQFYPKEDGIKEMIDNISNFGNIAKSSMTFRENNEKYSVSFGENNTCILTKVGKNEWIGILCENEFEKQREYKLKIKLLKNQFHHIRVGIVPKDYDTDLSNFYSCGCWYYSYYGSLYSGPPYNYSNKQAGLSKINKEIIMVVDTSKGTLKFIIDNVDKGVSFSNIQVDKNYVFVIFLYDVGDSVEVSEC